MDRAMMGRVKGAACRGGGSGRGESSGRRGARCLSFLASTAALVVAGAALAACSSQASTSTASSSSCWSKATSASACGGMASLVKAAKAEGSLNVIALPPDWANYGSIISAFEKKYGIKVNSANPNGSSGEELAAIKAQQGSAQAPDVVDVGPSFAVQGASEGLFAPYKVATWSSIPADQKAPNGAWFDDYGGYIAVGYDASIFKQAPTSLSSLLSPEFKGSVCLDGNPESSQAAFSAVYAAALANGGSFGNIEPGIQYFKKLAKAGNFVPTGATPATIGSGQCRVSLDWSYLQVKYAQGLAPKGVKWKVFVPPNAEYASYYVQAISKFAPDPAAARLWEEFLYSPAGQNLWLAGYASPVELPAMTANGTVDRSLLSALPKVTGVPSFPTQAELSKAQQAVVNQWPSI